MYGHNITNYSNYNDIILEEEDTNNIKREQNLNIKHEQYLDDEDMDLDMEDHGNNMIEHDNEDSDEDYFPDLKTKDIRRMLLEEPNRIKLKEASSSAPGRVTKVWKYFHQVFLY